jgi:hypothetical protein
MPLIKSSSPEAFESNLKAELSADKPRDQALAIAYRVKRDAARARGGKVAAEEALPSYHELGMRVPKGGSMCANCRFLSSDTTCGNERFVKWNGGATLPAPKNQYCCDLYEHHAEHAAGGAVRDAVADVRRARGGKVLTGAIKGDAPGRVDVHEAKVPDGSYVVSADVISHLGQNNSDAGLKMAEHMFGPKSNYASMAGEERHAGGKATGAGKPVDCVLASGEYAIAPHVVRSIGRGDVDLGHKILDKWSMDVRKDHIRTLASLPPPAKD